MTSAKGLITISNYDAPLILPPHLVFFGCVNSTQKAYLASILLHASNINLKDTFPEKIIHRIPFTADSPNSLDHLQIKNIDICGIFLAHAHDLKMAHGNSYF